MGDNIPVTKGSAKTVKKVARIEGVDGNIDKSKFNAQKARNE